MNAIPLLSEPWTALINVIEPYSHGSRHGLPASQSERREACSLPRFTTSYRLPTSRMVSLFACLRGAGPAALPAVSRYGKSCRAWRVLHHYTPLHTIGPSHIYGRCRLGRHRTRLQPHK